MKNIESNLFKVKDEHDGIQIKSKARKKKWSGTHVVKLLSESDRFGDSVGDFLGQLALLGDVLHQVVHLVDVPENTLAGLKPKCSVEVFEIALKCHLWFIEHSRV